MLHCTHTCSCALPTLAPCSLTQPSTFLCVSGISCELLQELHRGRRRPHLQRVHGRWGAGHMLPLPPAPPPARPACRQCGCRWGRRARRWRLPDALARRRTGRAIGGAAAPLHSHQHRQGSCSALALSGLPANAPGIVTCHLPPPSCAAMSSSAWVRTVVAVQPEGPSPQFLQQMHEVGMGTEAELAGLRELAVGMAAAVFRGGAGADSAAAAAGEGAAEDTPPQLKVSSLLCELELSTLDLRRSEVRIPCCFCCVAQRCGDLSSCARHLCVTAHSQPPSSAPHPVATTVERSGRAPVLVHARAADGGR